MPIRLAVLATFFAPSSQATRAKTVLTEERVAASREIIPLPRPSLFDTTHGFGLVVMNAGDEESTLNDGGIPSSSAVTSTKVLNDEPAWRLPCVARLNLLFL